jgi:hypothetical protein
MTMLSTIEFNWWDEECDLISEIKKLKGINIEDQENVCFAIETLESLDKNLYGLLLDHDIFFDETGIAVILNLYRQSIDSLKVHEGVDFEKARTAFRTALRFLQLMVGMLFDSYYYWCPDASKIVRELI